MAFVSATTGLIPEHQQNATCPLHMSTQRSLINIYKKELNLGRISGPFEKGDLQPSVHINRFGIIPKKHQEGKYRLIVDMSYPDGESINDGIDPDLCLLTYLKLEEVVHAVGRKGKGAL